MSKIFASLAAVLILCSCGRPRPNVFTVAEMSRLSWDEIVKRSRHTTVHFGMWAGDEERNRLFKGPVSERLQRQYGITLALVPATDTAEFVNKLLNEKRAGRTAGGSIDMLWINGENFRSAKQAAILWGPFADRVPNVRLYDPASLTRDFGTEIEGYEAPWQRSQFVFAYDTARVKNPPRSVNALMEWARAHPGRFTYIAPPDFTGSAFIRHLLVYFGGGPAGFHAFDEDLYQRASAATLDYLNQIKPFLWRRGETYPPTLRELCRLMANNEIDFSMSYGPSFASVRIQRGEFPPTVRTFVLGSGTLANYSYLAIPFNASNIPGALVALDYFLSFPHMLEEAQRLGDSHPHKLELLSPEQRAAVDALPRGVATLSEAELNAHAIPEPDSQYLERLEKDWQTKVLQR